MPRQPVFAVPTIYEGDLNAVADKAWENLSVSGGHVSIGANGRQIIIPRNGEEIWARVWLVPDATSGTSGGASATGSTSPEQTRCPNKYTYAFQQVLPISCGDFEDDELGRSGNGISVVAYEQNNQRVRDDSIQRLYFHLAWLDEDVDPAVMVEEWVFGASAGTSLGGNEPEEFDVECLDDEIIVTRVEP